MAATAPQLDDRRYRELLDETLARVPVHTPEWTNFNPSDPTNKYTYKYTCACL